MTFPYEKLTTALLSDLPPRAQDVLQRRFGLREQEPETVAAIGQSHGITRERVRQIVEDGLHQLRELASGKKEQEKLEVVFQRFFVALRESGSVKRQDLLVQEVGAPEFENHIIFLLHLGDQFHKHRETEYVYPFWTSEKEMVEISPGLLETIYAYLQERRTPLEFEELTKAHKVHEGEKLHPRTLASLLEVSKLVARTHNGKWGLREWPEVYPKGMRDKAYVVLRDEGRSLHFVEVAKLIEKLQEVLAEQSASSPRFGGAGWRERTVLPQTVHNELIKDPRFVLVGRGTYALEEWGYKPGTVKDVIREILRENGKAMPKEEIVQKTLAQRQVKESTILLNLQDKTCFLREGEGYICIGE